MTNPPVLQVTQQTPTNTDEREFLSILTLIILACSVQINSVFLIELSIYVFVAIAWPQLIRKSFISFMLIDIFILWIALFALPTTLYFCVKILAIVRPFLFRKFVIKPYHREVFKVQKVRFQPTRENHAM